MQIPYLVYMVAKTACIASLILYVVSELALLVPALKSGSSWDVQGSAECFGAGKIARRIALAFLAVLLFLVAKSAVFSGLTLVGAVSGIVKLYTQGMLAVLAFSVLVSIVLGTHRATDAMKKQCAMLRHSSLVWAIAGFAVLYVCLG